MIDLLLFQYDVIEFRHGQGRSGMPVATAGIRRFDGAKMGISGSAIPEYVLPTLCCNMAGLGMGGTTSTRPS
jgi:hypothetical protein